MNKIVAWLLAVTGMAAQPAPAILNQPGKLNTEAVSADTTDKSDAIGGWVTFGKEIESENMTFFDGGQSDKSLPTYNEKVVIDGVDARKVYGSNYIYTRFDESFYNPEEDSCFFIKLKFYEFGPQKGTFYLSYPTRDGATNITIVKNENPQWATRTFFVDNAYFNHSIDDIGADIKIINGAYNAFASLEVVNANGVADDNSYDVGVAATENANILSQLGLYPENYSDILENKLTRKDVAKRLVTLLGKENEEYKTTLTDADEKESSALGYLEHNKLAEWSGSASENVTQLELVQIFARLSGVSTESDVFQNMMDEKLLKSSNVIIQPSKTAIEDNFAALAYNWLLAKNKTGKPNIADLLARGIVTKENVMSSSESAIKALAYSNPTEIETKQITDPYTGRKYYYTHKGDNTVREYYTANQWTSDNKRFVVEEQNARSPIFLYDTEKHTLQYLCEANATVVGASDKMYYIDPDSREVRTMDLNTFEVKTIAMLPDSVLNWWGLSITNDEKFMAINWQEGSSELDYAKPFGGTRYRKCPVLDIENGTWNAEFHKEFTSSESAGMNLNHVIINPAYDNLVFFCHEGTTTIIPDRIWLLDTDKNSAFNLFRQKQVTEELTGETAGHEMWFGDGNRLAFVKYTFGTNIGYSGIMTIDLTGKKKEYVSNEYRYWHCSASPADDRFIVADTNKLDGNMNEIVLVDRYTGEAHLLCRPQLGKSVHPGHAHPSFSPDGKKVSFVMNDGTGIIATAWMDVSDIVDKPADGGRISISETCEVPSYKGCVNYIKEAEKAGEKCYKVSVGNRMLVNVKDDKYQADRADVKITFSYYDESYMPVKLSYFGWNSKLSRLDKTEQMFYTVDRKNTKKWITKTIELKDINIDNMELIGTDFKIEGSYADLYIKDVNVEVTNVISDFMDQLPWTKFNKEQ